MTDVELHPSTHPPLPPTTEDERLTWLRLLRSRRVGIATFYRLIHEHGSADAALAALPDIAQRAGVRDYTTASMAEARREMAKARKARAQMVCVGDPTYPRALLDIDDPPPILWVCGSAEIMNKPMIGMVGARNASSLGLRMARLMAADLADAGYIVVSGLARGIDGAAHQAALNGGTIAVMAGGVDVIYPADHGGLGRDIVKTGARVSEIAMGQTPHARHFPRRNRLISGLAQAIVVIEAAAKSGSLITARNALDQGREVLAVPGHPFDARSAGNNMLIRDGARLVRSAADVIEALPPLVARSFPNPAGPIPAGPNPDGPDPNQPSNIGRTHSGPRHANPSHDDSAGDIGQAPKHLAKQDPQANAAPDPQPDRHPNFDFPIPPPSPAGSLREIAALHNRILSRLSPAPLAEDQLIRDVDRGDGNIPSAVSHLEIIGQVRRQAGGLLAKISRDANANITGER